jgi:FtsP/CotA-like multicopper oxidase with cupredoxin domain
MLAACHARSPTVEQRALAEFDGVYPVEAHPTGVVREFDVVAEPTELALVDGKPLKVWAYNRQVPGPTLRIKLGETLRVQFTNHLPQETTIHWHGVRLPNAMDGVPNITQRAVQPGETFVYEFTPKDAGTFWFHPHVRASEQVERGLYGVLVVEDANPAPYARDLWMGAGADAPRLLTESCARVSHVRSLRGRGRNHCWTTAPDEMVSA